MSKVTQQAMNYAIRSGVSITAGYAIRQSSRLLKSVPKSNERDELLALQDTLRNKIRIISPAIDMIELITARGNTSLESAVSLTKSLRLDIQALGQRLAQVALVGETDKNTGQGSKSKLQNEVEIRSIINDIKKMIARLEDAIPSINLAITTSGAKLSSDFPSTISPTRFAQASNFLSNGDLQYSMTPDQAVQIGPTFTLSVYMLFAGNIRPEDEEGVRETTWKEVMHKARVKLRRVPMNLAFGERTSQTSPANPSEGENHIPASSEVNEFAYQLVIIEDLDDNRVHDFDENESPPGPLDEVELAGIRELVPIHQVSKIFYADTGKVLNIGSEGETNNPVLLLKRDINAIPPRKMMHREMEQDWYGGREEDGQADADPRPSSREAPAEPSKRPPWSLPPGLDLEWLAFEVYTEPAESSDEDDRSSVEGVSQSTDHRSLNSPPGPQQLTSPLSKLRLSSSNSNSTPSHKKSSPPHQSPSKADGSLLPPYSSNLITQPPPWNPNLKILTSLSLLEVLLRLTSLQQFQQSSHLSVTDELLNFFLDESATTGAGGDEGYRQRLRANARRQVGWDPYDESPIKRRGEEYQYRRESADGEYGGVYGGSPRWDGREEDYNNYYLRSRENTPASPSPRGATDRIARSPMPVPPRTQTRSITTDLSSPASSLPFTPDRPSPSLPMTMTNKNRTSAAAFLRRGPTADEGRRKESPLRRQTGNTDEGLGTSPEISLSRLQAEEGT